MGLILLKNKLNQWQAQRGLMQNVLDRLTFILTHHILLVLAVTGSFLAFSIHPGSIGDVMKVCGVLFLINLVTGHYRFSDFTTGHIIQITRK